MTNWNRRYRRDFTNRKKIIPRRVLCTLGEAEVLRFAIDHCNRFGWAPRNNEGAKP